MTLLRRDFAAPLRRFPLPLLFLALATGLFIAADRLVAEPETSASGGDLVWLAWGCLGAALLAVAGRLLAESGRDGPVSRIAFEGIGPLLLVAAVHFRELAWVEPMPLFFASILWAALAGALGGPRGEARCWWLTHRAATTALIALFGLGVVLAGLLAISGSLSLLFGIDIEEVVTRYLIPFAGAFLAPAYWLSTIPHPAGFEAEADSVPDFVSRALGFLAQFVLTPFLFLYSLILFAYAVQIAIEGALPEGRIGWMVLSYLTVGAANWLLLYPAFVRDSRMAVLFRRSWFWLTLVPLGLFALAVYVRIEAYGFTPERVFLVAGGSWAAGLALAFLTGLCRDIRLIPGLAIVLLVAVSVGPLNFDAVAIRDQSARLTAALTAANWSAEGQAPEWTEDTADRAESAFLFLRGEGRLDAVAPFLAERGLTVAEPFSRVDIALLRLPERGTDAGYVRLSATTPAAPVDMTGTPHYLGRFSLDAETAVSAGPYELRLDGSRVVLTRGGAEADAVDLVAWAERQDADGGSILDPVVALTDADTQIRLVVEQLSMNLRDESEDAGAVAVSGLAFAASAMPLAARQIGGDAIAAPAGETGAEAAEPGARP